MGRFFLLWFVVALAGSGCTTVTEPRRLPNIVLVLVDDLGWTDLGCQGSDFYETPSVDSLAGQGIRFSQAYSGCPVCSPSRAQLMTGRNQARLPFTGHITAILRHRYPEKGRIIPPEDYMHIPLEEVTIAEALKPAGYVSASIGKWHLGIGEEYWPEAQGFDLNVAGWTHGSPPSYFYPYTRPGSDWNAAIPTLQGGQEGEYLTDRLTDEAIRFVRENDDRPFFLYLSFYSVHTPLQAPAELIRKYEEKRPEGAPHSNPVYAAMIEKVDTNVGRLIETLDELALADDTVVIFTSDNGGAVRDSPNTSTPTPDVITSNQPLRSGKGYLYEGGIRVPLIMRWPGNIQPNSVSNRIVANCDLYATIVDLVGEQAQPGSNLDGESLLPTLRGRDVDRKEALYWYHPHYSRRPGAAMRVGDWKLIEFYDPPSIELYNLSEDLGEQSNLATEMPDRANELLQRLRQWIEDSGTELYTLNPDYEPEGS
jgi:arylsulfatase A-like enzyme